MKALGITMTSLPSSRTPANLNKKPQPSNMLESSYSKSFIYAPQTKDMDVKKETDVIDLPETTCSLSRNELDDLMEDDSHPVSSSDPMLSSPAPSSFSSSSPSSFYSSDETLSPQSIDLIV